MPYFQLRITFSELRNRELCLRSIDKLIKHYELVEYSCGVEKLNKYGEPCDPHIHFNFIADVDRVNPKRCIQDWLRRWFIKRDVELKGNKMWSLQMVEEPKDYERWFRYPLKELPITELVVREDWKTEDEEIDWKAANFTLAMEERKTSIEHNILRREKLRNKDQFKQKMYDFIDEVLKGTDIKKPTYNWIWCEIYHFYQKIEKQINFSVITGYTNLWLADHGFVSAQDAFKIAHNNNDN